MYLPKKRRIFTVARRSRKMTKRNRVRKDPREAAWSELNARRSEEIPRSGWVRLFAESIPGAEEARNLGLSAITGEKSFEFDRKLGRDISLFRVLGTQMYFSDAFLDYLIRAGVTGLSDAVLVPHYTPNSVHRRPFYRVKIEGQLGTIHKSTRTKPHRASEKDVARFPDIFEHEIFEPVTIDGATWSGHDLCRSSQSFPGLYVWRALFIRVEVLHRVPPPPDLYLNPVSVVNLASPKHIPAFLAPEVKVPEPPPRRSIAEVWASWPRRISPSHRSASRRRSSSPSSQRLVSTAFRRSSSS